MSKFCALVFQSFSVALSALGLGLMMSGFVHERAFLVPAALCFLSAVASLFSMLTAQALEEYHDKP